LLRSGRRQGEIADAAAEAREHVLAADVIVFPENRARAGCPVDFHCPLYPSKRQESQVRM
jgi:hypothetical protein